jgi:hypothetical protein
VFQINISLSLFLSFALPPSLSLSFSLSLFLSLSLSFCVCLCVRVCACVCLCVCMCGRKTLVHACLQAASPVQATILCHRGHRGHPSLYHCLGYNNHATTVVSLQSFTLGKTPRFPQYFTKTSHIFPGLSLGHSLPHTHMHIHIHMHRHPHPQVPYYTVPDLSRL